MKNVKRSYDQTENTLLGIICEAVSAYHHDTLSRKIILELKNKKLLENQKK